MTGKDGPHITILAGKKGSGKTTLLLELLTTHGAYRSVYHEIVIISPTFERQFKDLWSKLDPDGITVHSEVSDGLVENLMNRSAETSLLVISDDCGEDWRKVSPKIMNKFISNSRHAKTSIVFLCQRILQVGPIVRTNADSYIVFQSMSFMELTCLYNHVSVCDKRTFLTKFSEATREHYSFFVASMIKGHVKCYSSFKTELLMQ